MAHRTVFALACVLPLSYALGCGGDDTSDPLAPTGAGAGATTGGGAGGATTSGGGASGGGGVGGAGGAPMPPTPSAICADMTSAIVDATGATIEVSPGGDGEVIVGGETTTLRSVIQGAQEGDTILLADGTYTLPAAPAGGYTGLYFTTPNVTLRSASGDASAVVIDSAYRLHGGQSAAITIDAPGVVLANFTVERAVFHLIHLWDGGDDALIHDVVMEDGGQQFLKSSPGGGNVDGVEVSCSQFVMTVDGRDNVWGYGPAGGNTSCYTGGIDTHDARSWHVHDSFFHGIHCDDSPHPAHGEAGDTYVGGLAEHAIHMWDAPDGFGHLIERNTIVDCARGIGIGFNAETYDTVIRNNIVSSRHENSPEHDVGISIMRAHDTVVAHNTVVYSHASAYPDTIEYRYASTSNVVIVNNLTNGNVRARDGATADLQANVADADVGWFVDATEGDLHLATCDVATVVDSAVASDVTVDVDGDERSVPAEIGADECTP